MRARLFVDIDDDASFEMVGEKFGEFFEGNQTCLIVKINMAGPWDDQQFFRFRRSLVGGFAEITRVSLFAMNHEDGARRYFLDVGQERHVHEGQRIGDGP